MDAPTSLSHLEWPAVVAAVFERLASPAAMRLFGDDVPGRDEALLPRYTTAEPVESSLGRLRGLEVALGRTGLSALGGAALCDVDDVTAPLHRAARGVTLSLEELAQVADLASALSGIRAALRVAATQMEDDGQADFEALLEALEDLAVDEALAESLERSIARDGTTISLADTASPSLGRLRALEATKKRELGRAAQRLIRDPNVEAALADRYWTEREGRVVLPVRSDAFSRAGGAGTLRGIIHAASNRGQTLFVEPHELVEPANAQRQASLAVAAEEAKILAKLSEGVGQRAEDLERGLEALVELDVLQAKLRLCHELDGLGPHVAEPRHSSWTRLPAARHPLMVLRGTEVVPSDIEVSLGGALIISGPNAGGKTVALKTLGLCVLMARAGLRLPTGAPAHLPLFHTVVTDVGDDQSIAANLSTFSAHIGHVLEALEAAEEHGAGCLALFDEVCTGTDPDQGAALAHAVVTTLVQRGATVVATTHYERLKLLAVEHPDRFTNASVGFDLENLRPTFRLHLGLPGPSSALAVARRLGLSESVLGRAEGLLDDTRLQVDALLADLESERTRLVQARESMERQQRDLSAREAKLEARERRDLSSAAEKQRKAHERATSELRALEDTIKSRRKELRRREVEAPGPGSVTDPAARSLARDAQARLRANRPVAPQTSTSPPARQIEVGDTVHVPSFRTDGTILSIKGDKITVQLPLAKVTVERDTLAVAAPGPKPKALRLGGPPPPPSTAKRHFGPEAQPVDPKIDNVVDVRGVRAEEAITMVEVFVDRALSDDEEITIVRHGHGSGALRRAIREHLPRLPHVRTFRSGLPPEGGDGVTVVWVGG